MFVGHLAVALGAKKVEPRVPLPALVMAAFGLDVLWPIFVLAGLEVVRIDPGNTAFTPFDFVSYPWSHSLLMSVVWGLLAALLTVRWLGSQTAGIVIGVAVVSHWVLDYVTHRPDLPLWPGGGPLVGLGLWNSIPGTIGVEGALFATGIAMYIRTVPSADVVGRWGFWSLIALLTVVWLIGPFSPPPPSPTAVAITGLVAAVVFPIWVAWVDRHRSP